MDTPQKIKMVCNNLADFLTEKNVRYGDSALNPLRIFSKADADEQLKVRVDDKLSRIKNSPDVRRNDVVDLAGYLILFMAGKDWLKFEDLID